MKIRPACVDDASEIAEIYNHYVSAGGSTFDTIRWTESVVRRWIPPKPPGGWYVAVDDDATVIGWTTLRPISQREGFRHTCESAIYLLPAAQGRGIADPLQNAIFDHCRRHGVHHVMARIIADNQRSVAFHQRHGFETVGIQKEVGYLNKRWVDLVVMQLLVDIPIDD
ncbi:MULTISPECIES: GNAT family N-acetyltransferase [Crateriforma]|uniref:N-acyltransferase YncA n=1 Tax=Crateriforma conspicua TaxID=2527996 RepID=A0A5C6FRU6_9PLAN|nr:MULTISPECIES: GNAT family N-acetyltransferase [Crateriforma]TWU63216.1 N-acyltransferase YncA [Crateriforma conspicua]